jgi:hypothetical protein
MVVPNRVIIRLASTFTTAANGTILDTITTPVWACCEVNIDGELTPTSGTIYTRCVPVSQVRLTSVTIVEGARTFIIVGLELLETWLLTSQKSQDLAKGGGYSLIRNRDASRG